MIIEWRVVERTWQHGRGLAYQILIHAFVQLPLCRSALPQLLVVVLQTLPVFTKFFQARLVDILLAIGRVKASATSILDADCIPKKKKKENKNDTEERL